MNVEQMTNRLQEIMQRAIMIANSNHNPQLCVEHVLKALNSDDGIIALWNKLNVDYGKIDVIIDKYLAKLNRVDNTNITLNREVENAYNEALNWSKKHEETYMSSVSMLIALLFGKTEVATEIVNALN